jgi:MFS family permease
MIKEAFTSQERKILMLASLGGMLEFYDFIIYGIFSVYFAHQFFPSLNQFIVIIQSYLVFILGYIVRPLGGIIFSHIGDEYGRKKVLVLTILIMGTASLGIGCLPTYSQWGIFSPLVLLTLRLLQGLALGGELPSTYVYISESFSHKRSVAFGIIMTGVNSGLLLGMLINTLLNYFLTTEQLVRFGWRIPFIIGGLVCIISYRIRKTLNETAAFTKIVDKPKIPIVHLLKNHFMEFLTGTSLVALMAGSVVVVIIFMPTYLKSILKLNNGYISSVMNALIAINLIIVFFTGLLTQKYKPFFVFKIVLIASVLLIPLSYFLMQQNHIIFGLMLLGGMQGMATMLTPYLLTSVFENKIHLTGVALSYNIGFTLFGGLSPLIITNLIGLGYNMYLVPVFYLLSMIAICGLGLIFYKKKTYIDMKQ